MDCTLRDGGYVNNWDFGEKNIIGIINKLKDANTDIIECGFYEPRKDADSGKSVFSDLKTLDNSLKGDQEYCVMLVFGCCGIEDVPENTFEHVKTIRVTFHKDDANDAIEFCKKLQEKGYNVSVQPVNTLNYSLDEFEALVKKVNEINPYAFYIVDTLGAMSGEQVLEIFNVANKNLSKDIQIGFHSHNNLQLAFSNAWSLMDINTDRNLIIDSSVFGMGRGSGNLCTELLMQNLNDRYGTKYDLTHVYKIFNEHLSGIFEKYPWGYSMALFVSAKYKCHPNYALFLKNKGLEDIERIDRIISKIDENKKNMFDEEYIKKLYETFKNANE